MFTLLWLVQMAKKGPIIKCIYDFLYNQHTWLCAVLSVAAGCQCGATLQQHWTDRLHLFSLCLIITETVLNEPGTVSSSNNTELLERKHRTDYLMQRLVEEEEEEVLSVVGGRATCDGSWVEESLSSVCRSVGVCVLQRVFRRLKSTWIIWSSRKHISL